MFSVKTCEKFHFAGNFLDKTPTVNLRGNHRAGGSYMWSTLNAIFGSIACLSEVYINLHFSTIRQTCEKFVYKFMSVEVFKQANSYKSTHDSQKLLPK